MLCDAQGAFGNPTSDSARTMMTLATRSTLVIVYAPGDVCHGAPASPLAATDDGAHALLRRRGGSDRRSPLTAPDPLGLPARARLEYVASSARSRRSRPRRTSRSPSAKPCSTAKGPCSIVAGAGSGKTTVLTRRIAHLIASKRARPEEILALTFTEKAAVEMAERVDQLIPYGYAETWIGTFHAFGDRLLRDAALEGGMNPEFRVLTLPEQIIFLRERSWRLPLQRFRPLGDPTKHLRALLTLVSRAKDENVSPVEYRAWAEQQVAKAACVDHGDADDARAARDEAARHLELAGFYAAYQDLLVEAGVVDFGDQIHRTLTLMRERPALLAKLRARYRYVLVDEFQDTNQAQLELIGLLAGEQSNITVVGDDDQAIYRWRGAAAANLLAFRRQYPGAREVVLSHNHRSTQPILDAATRLIGYNNPYRLEAMAGIDKRLRSRRGGRPRRAPPALRHGFGRGRCRGRHDRREAAAGIAPARSRDPGPQQQRRRAVPPRPDREGHRASLQRQPWPLRPRRGAASRRVPSSARQPGRFHIGLLPRRL